MQLSMPLPEVELGACSLQAAQAALETRNARYRVGPGRQSSDEEDAPDRVKDRLEQAERAVEKFVTRRLKAVQPGLEKVSTPALRAHSSPLHHPFMTCQGSCLPSRHILQQVCCLCILPHADSTLHTAALRLERISICRGAFAL